MKSKRGSSKSQRAAVGWAKLALAGTLAVAGSAAAAGCLERPVTPLSPKTTNVFVSKIKQTAVNKIDLLFMIDNSISMADKQAVLKDAGG